MTTAKFKRAYAFVEEFGEDIAKLATKDRKHDVYVDIDVDGYVRLFTEVNGFEYMAESVIFDPRTVFAESLEDLHELGGVLGLAITPTNLEVLRARLKRAGLE